MIVLTCSMACAESAAAENVTTAAGSVEVLAASIS
jgi:hypothetical protein